MTKQYFALCYYRTRLIWRYITEGKGKKKIARLNRQIEAMEKAKREVRDIGDE